MILKQINWLKLACVSALRAAYKDSATPEEYRYNADENLSKLWIWRGFPSRILRYPQIVVQADPIDASIAFLGDEELKEERDESGNLKSIIYFGPLKIPISMHIEARTTTDCEILTDLTMIYVRHIFRNKFSEYGFAFTKILIGGETQETRDNESIFKNSVKIDCYSEYEFKLDASLINTIDKINLDVEVLEVGT